MSHIIDSYEMLGLEKLPSATQAMRFIQGLDNGCCNSMQTSFANELHNGRDLYPTDLPSAVLKASRWMVSGKRSHDPLRALAATKSGKGKDKDKPKAKGKEKPSTKCDFCGRTNHSVSCLHATNTRKRKLPHSPQQRRKQSALQDRERALQAPRLG
jgi:hypothetical protein